MISELSLFSGIPEAEHPALLARIGAVQRRYARNDSLFMEGARPPKCGVILSGSAVSFKNSAEGSETITEYLAQGDVFGVPFVLRRIPEMPFSCRCRVATEVLFFDPLALFALNRPPCPGQQRLLDNLLAVLANKTLQLQRKVECLSHRTIRQRLLVYLTNCLAPGCSDGVLVFNLTELARYLCVDRAALSRELGRMRRERLLVLNGRRFRLLAEAYTGG